MLGGRGLFRSLFGLKKKPGCGPADATAPTFEQPSILVEGELYAWGRAEEPLMDIVLVHGLQLGDGSDAHISTWSSDTASLPTLLLDDYPQARILSVSWKSSAFEPWDDPGRVIAENLVYAGVGQSDRPVMLIGHSVGGLVMMQALEQIARPSEFRSLDYAEQEKYKNLLSNLQTAVYVATPFYGTHFNEFLRAAWMSWKHAEVSSGALNERMLYHWTEGVIERYEAIRASLNKIESVSLYETRPTKRFGFHKIVVPQHSATFGQFAIVCAIASNHIEICQPSGPASQFYIQVKSAVERMIARSTARTSSRYASRIVQ